jgi:hypothetical protein
MPDATPAEAERPTALFVVACFDALLAVLAILIALAPFGGAVQVAGKTISLALPLQILLAVDGALYAACVITVMVTLTRHDRWVRRTQIGLLALPIAILALSALLEQLIHHDLGAPQILASLLVALLDALVILAMTGRRVVFWYARSAPSPTWVRVLVGLFAVLSLAAVLIGQVG